MNDYFENGLKMLTVHTYISSIESSSRRNVGNCTLTEKKFMSVLNLKQRAQCSLNMTAWILKLFWCVGKLLGELSRKHGEVLSIIVCFHLRGHSHVSCELFRRGIHEKQQRELLFLSLMAWQKHGHKIFSEMKRMLRNGS